MAIAKLQTMDPNILETFKFYVDPKLGPTREHMHLFRNDLRKIAENTGIPGVTNWGGIGGNITDQSDLIAYVASQITVADIDTSNVIYSIGNGNNSTGQVNSLTKPFADPYAARAAAIAAGGSWTIIVYPGTVVIPAPLLLSPNINYLFLGKGVLTCSSGTQVLDTVAGASVVVHAEGWNLNDTGSKYIIRASAIGSSTIVVYNQMNSNTGNTIWLDNNANLSIVGNRVYSALGYAAVESDTGYTGTFTGGGDTIYDVNAGGGATFQLESGNFSVKGRTLTGHVGCIKTENTTITDVLSFEFDRIYNRTGAGWSVWMTGASPYQVVRANDILSTGTCSCVSGGSAIVTIICPSVRNTSVTTYGLLHAENTSTLIAIGCVLSRNPAATGDDVDAEVGATLKLVGVVYDVTRTDISGSIVQWNGNTFVPIPKVINNPAGSGNVVTKCNLIGGIIDFGGFTGCTLTTTNSTDSTITFISDNQTIQNQIWLSGRNITPANEIVIVYDPVQMNSGGNAALGVVFNNTGLDLSGLTIMKTGTGNYVISIPGSSLSTINLVDVQDFQGYTGSFGGTDLIMFNWAFFKLSGSTIQINTAQDGVAADYDWNSRNTSANPGIRITWF